MHTCHGAPIPYSRGMYGHAISFLLQLWQNEFFATENMIKYDELVFPTFFHFTFHKGFSGIRG